MNVGVTNPVKVSENGNTRICLHAGNQAFSSTRHDHVDQASRLQHRAYGSAVLRRQQLDRIGR